MVLTFLTCIFFAGGVIAILYSILALFSLMNHARAEKAVPDKYEPEADMPATGGPPVAEAIWGRAKIFLQNQRFDAAFADCKRVLEINPNHADAKRLLEHLFSPGLVPRVPAEKVLIPAAETEKAAHKDNSVLHDSEPKQAEAS